MSKKKLNQQCSKIKKYIQAEEASKISNQFPVFIELLNTMINEKRITNQPISHSLSNTIVTSFSVLKMLVSSNKIFDKIRLSVDFSRMPRQIRDAMLHTPLLISDSDFYNIIWKKSVKIVTFLLDSSNVHLWHEAIQRLFLSSSCNIDVLKESRILSDRFRFLCNYILKRKPQIISLWWEVISSVILSLFIPYPVISLDGKVIPKNCLDGQCPKSVFDDVIHLFKNHSARSACLLRKDSPNESISLIYLLLHYTEFSNDSLLEWFTSLWFPLANTNFRNYEPFSLFTIFSALAPEIIISFMQLFAKYVTFKLLDKNNRNQDSIFQFTTILRNIWCGPIQELNLEEYYHEILRSIYKEISQYFPALAFILYLTFCFDAKIVDNRCYKLLLQTEIFDKDWKSISIIFISIMSTTLSPLLFNFEINQVKEYFNSLKIKKQRLKEDYKEIETYLKIFNDPKSLLSVLPTEYFNESKIKVQQLIDSNSIYLLELHNKNWDFEFSINFSCILMNSFPQDFQLEIYGHFICSLSFIQRILPLNIIKNKFVIWERFIIPMLKYFLVTKINNQILYSINYSLENLGFYINDNENSILWIELIIKFLSSSSNNYIINLAYQTTLKFPPNSYILISILNIILTLNISKIPKNLISNFNVTSYTLYNYECNFLIPSQLNEIVSQWDSSQIDYNILNKSLLLVDPINRSLFQKTLQLAIQKIPNEETYSFTNLVPIFIIELFNNKNKLTEWIQNSITNVKINENLINVSRMILFLSDLQVLIQKKFPNFYEDFVRNVLPNINDQFFLRSIFDLIVNTNDKIIKMFFDILKNKKNENEMKIFFDAIPFDIYKRYLPNVINPDEFDLHFVTKNKILILTKFNKENSFEFITNSLNNTMKFKVEQFETNENEYITNDKNIKTLPITDVNNEINEFQKEENEKLLKSLIDIFQIHENDEINSLQTNDIPIVNSDQLFKDLIPNNDSNDIVNDEINFVSKTCSNEASRSFFSTFCGDDIFCLKKTPLFKIKISSILNAPRYEQVKIGVLYVGQNQYDQKTILSNTELTCSQRFQDFLFSIGCFIDLTTHLRYNGKLSYNGKSVYYSNRQMEVMFHVSTLLPDDPTDEQKIEKKRHIGNDHVHIVWCEDCSGYDTSVISSQFNDAHIIIFPYPNMLYRVMAKRKNQELNFFPLPPDSIVGPKELGYLVRSTAIIADRVVRKENEMRPHEYFEKMFEVLNSDV